MLFIAGGLLQAVSAGVEVLVFGRVVIGLGVGVASVAAPLYAAWIWRNVPETKGRSLEDIAQLWRSE